MKRRIMVVEDDAFIQRFVRAVLEGAGHTVLLAGNGQDALDQLKQAEELPCLIFLDLMMPVMDGWTFRQAQSQDPRLSAIPVVVMSASGYHGAPIEADWKIDKPVSAGTILAAIASFC